MGYQPEYGNRLVREFYAGTDLPYYRLVQIDYAKSEIKLAGEDSLIDGLTIPSPKSDVIKDDGSIMPRKGYIKGEGPDILRDGVAYVETGGEIVAGSLVTSNNDGKAITLPEKELEQGTKNTALIKALRRIAGVAIDGAKKDGDLIRVELGRGV